MKQVALTNDTEKTIHCGPKSVRAGETREVDPTMIPEEHKKRAHGLKDDAGKKDKTEAPNPLLALLDFAIPAILMAIAEMINGEYKYSMEDLRVLEQAEEGGKTRNGVMSGIAEERLRRGTHAQEAEQLANDLPTADDEWLASALDTFAHDEGLLALVKEEINRRFVNELLESTDEDLTAALEVYAEEPSELALVQAEIDKRTNAV